MNKVRYTDEEIDYVIDRLDWGFMRDRVKSDPKYIEDMMNTFNGRWALLRLSMKNLLDNLKKSLGLK